MISQINLDDWIISGEGANGISYNHRDDDSVILKMNRASLPREHTEREFQRSLSLYEMDVSCPKVIELVTDGERYGLIVEKVDGKNRSPELFPRPGATGASCQGICTGSASAPSAQVRQWAFPLLSRELSQESGSKQSPLR